MICKTHFSDGDYVKLGRGFPQLVSPFPLSLWISFTSSILRVRPFSFEREHYPLSNRIWND